jgi:4'-phosphopantetheinyl transferase
MPDQRPFAVNPVDAVEIHLWQLLLSDAQPARESWLDQVELIRFQSFSGPVQARRYLVFRCAIRQILGNYLGVVPEELNFSIQPGGKPFIASPDCDLQFNLTHTGDVGMLAVSRGLAVGIDIEQIRPLKNKHAIARRVFRPTEIRLLEETANDEQDEYFFQLWTCMEARQKCHGSGIFGDKIGNQSVGIHQFMPMPGYCAAVAWEDPSVDPSLRFFK